MGGAGAANAVTRQPNPTGDHQRVGEGRELHRHGPESRNTPPAVVSNHRAKRKPREVGLIVNDELLDNYAKQRRSLEVVARGRAREKGVGAVYQKLSGGAPFGKRLWIKLHPRVGGRCLPVFAPGWHSKWDGVCKRMRQVN